MTVGEVLLLGRHELGSGVGKIPGGRNLGGQVQVSRRHGLFRPVSMGTATRRCRRERALIRLSGISRDSRHKRRATGGKQKAYRKKRKFELGRPPAMTKLGAKRIHPVRVRGGAIKFRALRLESGNFSWGSECTYAEPVFRVLCLLLPTCRVTCEPNRRSNCVHFLASNVPMQLLPVRPVSLVSRTTPLTTSSCAPTPS